MENPIQNTVSIVTPSAYVLSLLNQWSPVLTWTIGVITLAWYAGLFYDKYIKKK